MTTAIIIYLYCLGLSAGLVVALALGAVFSKEIRQGVRDEWNR